MLLIIILIFSIYAIYWPTTTGTITKKEIKYSYFMDNFNYSATITYDFTLDNETQKSNAIKLMHFNTTGINEKEVKTKDEYYMKYQEGQKIVVHYCPLAKQFSYLEKQNNIYYYIICLLIIISIIYLATQ